MKHEGGRYVHAHDGSEWPAATERDVFDLLGIAWLEPWERDAFIEGRMFNAAVSP